VGVPPDPATVTFTETACAVVMVVEAGATVTLGVAGFRGGGVVVVPLPPPQADIPITSPLTKRRRTALKPLFTLLILAIGVHRP
jgi:hypothetical protein